ncbi:MAG TPA: DUF3443 domain-containing protein, partial [Thermodesulfovibrionales bacterium]|nr:DUF3443 domain-containing protein [Thermodesulfovibrionales bacterium]
AEVNNVMSITVNGSLCSADTSLGYPNKPCVSVTICAPGTSTCQTINDILLDSGSTGLRIFKQALNVPLTQVSSGSGSLAECVQFGDGSSDWGPVEMASVILGNEPAIQVPVQVIDSTFGTLPIACGNADRNPITAGFTGILGIAFFLQDCGSACTGIADNGMYYSCNGPNCVGSSVSLSSQVQNPVALLPQDNNGVIMQLPSIPANGSPSVNGSLLLGIGTQANNTPSVVTTYAADEFGDFLTAFNGVVYSSFIDSGTNGLFFASPSAGLVPNCPDNTDWFCPASTVNLSATNSGASGSPSGMVSFQIGNFDTLTASSNNVFTDIGGESATDFEWGLPFFLGRNVYVGMEGKTSSLGSGLYWAY